MEFKDKIKKLRKQNKWTQEDLAKNLYISRTAVSASMYFSNAARQRRVVS